MAPRKPSTNTRYTHAEEFFKSKHWKRLKQFLPTFWSKEKLTAAAAALRFDVWTLVESIVLLGVTKVGNDGELTFEPPKDVGKYKGMMHHLVRVDPKKKSKVDVKEGAYVKVYNYDFKEVLDPMDPTKLLSL